MGPQSLHWVLMKSAACFNTQTVMSLKENGLRMSVCWPTPNKEIASPLF
jgi:hypothetical protein